MSNTRISEFGHVMIDLETMGNGSNSAIVAIAAVEFNLTTGKTGQTLDIRVSLESCLNCGLKMDADTVLWWMQQGENARDSITKTKGIHMSYALHELSIMIDFIGGKDVQIWGNSTRFDLGILSNAYRVISLIEPWDFRKERDVRTLASFNESLKKDYPFKGVKHSPLDDCFHQIEYCSAIWKSLT